MAELSGVAGAALKQTTGGDDAAADARSDEKADDIVGIASDAVEPLTISRRLYVVHYDDRQLHRRFKLPTQRKIAPAKIRGRTNDTRLGIDLAGNPDAEADDSGSDIGRNRRANAARERADNMRRPLPRLGQVALPLDDLSIAIDEGDLDLRGTEIHPDRQPLVILALVFHRRPSCCPSEAKPTNLQAAGVDRCDPFG